MLKIFLPWIALALVSCTDTKRPDLNSKNASGSAPSVINSRVDTQSGEITNDAGRTALYKEMSPGEKVIPHMPKLSCAQTALTPGGTAGGQQGGTPTTGGRLTISCRLMQGRLDYKPAPGTSIAWSYTHPSRSYTPTITGSDTNPVGRFEFTDPDVFKNLYFADTGKFSASISYEGRTLPIDSEKVQVVGENCTTPLPGLINVRQPQGYMTMVDQGGNFAGAVAGGRYIVSGPKATLNTDSDNAIILALNNTKIDYRGTGLRAVIMDSTSLILTNGGTATGIYAGPAANVPDRPEVYRFETDLGLCERQ